MLNIIKVNDQNKRPATECARLIRRIPCVGEFANQVLIISNAVFSVLDISSSDGDAADIFE
jgi:hypothetical protein